MTEHLDGCPELEDIAALAEGRLAGAERERVVAHLASCEECREVFAGTVGTMEEVGGAEGGVGGTVPQVVTELRPREGRRGRRGWQAGAVAAAATLVVVGSIVVYQRNAQPTPPSRSEWLAQMGPPERLVPELWGGVIMRGGGEGGELTRQSAELGALLVDLEVALAAGDAERAAELARRMATIMGEVGLLDEEVARLREAAGNEVDDQIKALRAELPRVEPSLRERFLAFYLDLGAFAEETRLAGLARDSSFLKTRRAHRYLEWLLSQREEPLPPTLEKNLAVLSAESASPAEHMEAASAILRDLTL